MSIPREAYETLQSIVGKEWVSDDPAVCEADRFCSAGGAPAVAIRPGCSIEPASTEEVQAIVKVANMYKVPFVATSTFYSGSTFAKKENTILIDLKRMNKLEIDEENLYAIVEPGVAFSALQGDLFKRGLFTFVPGCGGNSSVLANTLNMGDAPLGWRHGLGYQRILGAEWVLPDGEILKLGSRSLSRDFFWGEGPGPDLRGLVRGSTGWQSRMGIITRLGVKVFPFVNEELKPQGTGCHTHLNLPANRFKWYNIRFNTREDCINAMFEIGRCEIGMIVMTVPPMFFAVAKSRGNGCAGFWEQWDAIGPKLNPKQETLRVLLYGIGADKRLAYEEKVLLDIAADYHGSPREGGCSDETNFQAADAICANVIGGRFTSEVSYESINQAVRYSKVANEVTEQHRPPILQDYGTTNWVCPYELGYIAKLECLRMTAVKDEAELSAWRSDLAKRGSKGGEFTLVPMDTEVWGPAWGYFNKREEKFKKVFDPNNVSAPNN
jgi:glycolate oxidase